MTNNIEPLAALMRRQRLRSSHASRMPRASLQRALLGGDDPLQVVTYFATLGLALTQLEDLLKINDDPDEEELHAFRVQEGVAISIASDGAWALYVP